MRSPATALSPEQLEELQSLLKEWLRHSGRTQSDLRRALRAGSIRMPVLLDELHRTWTCQGVAGLAERLCAIEAQWLSEPAEPRSDQPQDEDRFDASMGQLDLLLQEIRNEHGV